MLTYKVMDLLPGKVMKKYILKDEDLTLIENDIVIALLRNKVIPNNTIMFHVDITVDINVEQELDKHPKITEFYDDLYKVEGKDNDD